MIAKAARLAGTAAMLAAGPSWATEPVVGPHALTDASQALVRAYNAEDAGALHGLLAPALQARYPLERLRTALTLCRVLTYDIHRLSLPSWGGRTYGFFAVYAEPKVFEMVLEIDSNARIAHLLITDDLHASEQQCRLSVVD